MDTLPESNSYQKGVTCAQFVSKIMSKWTPSVPKSPTDKATKKKKKSTSSQSPQPQSQIISTKIPKIEGKQKVILAKRISKGVDTFSFNRAFSQSESIEQMYKDTIQQLVKSLVQERRSSWLVLNGPEKSKKGLWMRSVSEVDGGLVGMIINDIFSANFGRQLLQGESTQSSVRVSFFSIANCSENVLDLLDEQQKPRSYSQSQPQKVHIGLAEREIFDVDDFLEILETCSFSNITSPQFGRTNVCRIRHFQGNSLSEINLVDLEDAENLSTEAEEYYQSFFKEIKDHPETYQPEQSGLALMLATPQLHFNSSLLLITSILPDSSMHLQNLQALKVTQLKKQKLRIFFQKLSRRLREAFRCENEWNQQNNLTLKGFSSIGSTNQNTNPNNNIPSNYNTLTQVMNQITSSTNSNSPTPIVQIWRTNNTGLKSSFNQSTLVNNESSPDTDIKRASQNQFLRNRQQSEDRTFFISDQPQEKISQSEIEAQNSEKKQNYNEVGEIQKQLEQVNESFEHPPFSHTNFFTKWIKEKAEKIEKILATITRSQTIDNDEKMSLFNQVLQLKSDMQYLNENQKSQVGLQKRGRDQQLNEYRKAKGNRELRTSSSPDLNQNDKMFEYFETPRFELDRNKKIHERKRVSSTGSDNISLKMSKNSSVKSILQPSLRSPASKNGSVLGYGELFQNQLNTLKSKNDEDIGDIWSYSKTQEEELPQSVDSARKQLTFPEELDNKKRSIINLKKDIIRGNKMTDSISSIKKTSSTIPRKESIRHTSRQSLPEKKSPKTSHFNSKRGSSTLNKATNLSILSKKSTKSAKSNKSGVSSKSVQSVKSRHSVKSKHSAKSSKSNKSIKSTKSSKSIKSSKSLQSSATPKKLTGRRRLSSISSKSNISGVSLKKMAIPKLNTSRTSNKNKINLFKKSSTVADKSLLRKGSFHLSTSNFQSHRSLFDDEKIQRQRKRSKSASSVERKNRRNNSSLMNESQYSRPRSKSMSQSRRTSQSSLLTKSPRVTPKNKKISDGIKRKSKTNSFGSKNLLKQGIKQQLTALRDFMQSSSSESDYEFMEKVGSMRPTLQLNKSKKFQERVKQYKIGFEKENQFFLEMQKQPNQIELLQQFHRLLLKCGDVEKMLSEQVRINEEMEGEIKCVEEKFTLLRKKHVKKKREKNLLQQELEARRNEFERMDHKELESKQIADKASSKLQSLLLKNEQQENTIKSLGIQLEEANIFQRKRQEEMEEQQAGMQNKIQFLEERLAEKVKGENEIKSQLMNKVSGFESQLNKKSEELERQSTMHQISLQVLQVQKSTQIQMQQKEMEAIQSQNQQLKIQYVKLENLHKGSSKQSRDREMHIQKLDRNIKELENQLEDTTTQVKSLEQENQVLTVKLSTGINIRDKQIQEKEYQLQLQQQQQDTQYLLQQTYFQQQQQQQQQLQQQYQQQVGYIGNSLSQQNTLREIPLYAHQPVQTQSSTKSIKCSQNYLQQLSPTKKNLGKQIEKPQLEELVGTSRIPLPSKQEGAKTQRAPSRKQNSRQNSQSSESKTIPKQKQSITARLQDSKLRGTINGQASTARGGQGGSKASNKQ